MLTIFILLDNMRYIMLLIGWVFLLDACKKRSEKGLLDVFILLTDPCCAVFTTVKQYGCSLPFF